MFPLGFKEYLCVNRGTSQDNCFIGRAVHNPSGRVLEVYSNQRCVCFSTGNDFGFGRVLSLQELRTPSEKVEDENLTQEHDEYLSFLKDIHNNLEEYLQEDQENNYEDLRNLLNLMGIKDTAATPANTPVQNINTPNLSIKGLILTNRQKDYLNGLYAVVVSEENELCLRLKNTINKLLNYSIVPDFKSFNNIKALNDKTSLGSELKTPKIKKKESDKNKIPLYYKKDCKITGKDRTIYRMHSGIAFQTQNFPCTENLKNFPSLVLNPGENYRHTVTYKIWIRAGNPSRWIKKNKNQMEKTL